MYWLIPIVALVLLIISEKNNTERRYIVYHKPTIEELSKLYHGLPERWGGGIHQLYPPAKSFFITLFTMLNTLGYDPHSDHPHRPHTPGGTDYTALDIIDFSWKGHDYLWQTPSPEAKQFIDALASVGHALGLSVGRDYKGIKWAGDDLPWAKAWRKAYGYEDVLHVEWYSRCGQTPPEICVDSESGQVIKKV